MLGNILPPYHSLQELNLDWILTQIKNMLRFIPDDGSVGQILRRTAHGAEWSNEQGGGGGAVNSVNGQTGDVVLTASDVGALPDTTPIPTKTSDLNNDSGFITSAQAPVQSVNGQTGTVTLTIPTKTSDLNNDSGFITAAGAPVQSVNGQTGAVSLSIPDSTSDLVNDSGFVDAAGAAAAAPVQSVNGYTGAVVIPAGAVLQQAASWVDAYTNAQSIIGVNAQDSSGNNWIVWIPKDLVTTTSRNWGVGDFHSTTDFNNYNVAVTTTTCTALRIWRGQYPQPDTITFWYM
ncbi:MAG: hypothetical protein IKY65_04405 [Rikenellaceae bacterium]|nr:hypothetical protein [Rikenellaceae bacterium]